MLAKAEGALRDDDSLEKPAPTDLQDSVAGPSADNQLDTLEAAALRAEPEGKKDLFTTLPGTKRAVLAEVTFVHASTDIIVKLTVRTPGTWPSHTSSPAPRPPALPAFGVSPIDAECTPLPAAQSEDSTFTRFLTVIYMSKSLTHERVALVCSEEKEEEEEGGEGGELPRRFISILVLQELKSQAKGSLLQRLTAHLKVERANEETVLLMACDASERSVRQGADEQGSDDGDEGIDEQAPPSHPFPPPSGAVYDDWTQGREFTLVHEHITDMLPHPTEVQAASLARISAHPPAKGGICRVQAVGGALTLTMACRRTKNGAITTAVAGEEPQLQKVPQCGGPGVLAGVGASRTIALGDYVYLTLWKPTGEWACASPSLRLRFQRRPGFVQHVTASSPPTMPAY